jgi:hypothetical protein
MPALVLIGYWILFTGITFLALQYLARKCQHWVLCWADHMACGYLSADCCLVCLYGECRNGVGSPI